MKEKINFKKVLTAVAVLAFTGAVSSSVAACFVHGELGFSLSVVGLTLAVVVACCLQFRDLYHE